LVFFAKSSFLRPVNTNFIDKTLKFIDVRNLFAYFVRRYIK